MSVPTIAHAPAPAAQFDHVGPRSGRGRRAVRLVRGRRTPSQLRILRVVLALMLLAAGGLSVYSAAQRVQAIAAISERDERLSVDAAEIYRSLADADATAASGLLAGGLEPSAVRARYEQDIRQAAASLVLASGEVGAQGPAADAVARINGQLPVYTGLVETARANNRQGFPVGGAYLRIASALMQDRILPAAEELHRIASDQLDAQYERATGVFLPGLPVRVASLIALAVAQVMLFRMTNRVFNAGLVTATVLSTSVLLWWMVALALGAYHLENAQRHSDSVTDVLGEARIAALKARGSESLALVARNGGAAEEAAFQEQAEQLHQVLERAPDFEGRADVEAATQVWLTAHGRVRDLDTGGDYAGAVRSATGDDSGSAATAFNRLDAALARAVDAERGGFVRAVGRGSRMFTGLDVGTGLLGVLAAAAVVWGIGRRLEEYR
ncbi:MAG: hypothetical protein ACRD0K_28060 [Egibacteraceae bacterium]